MMTGFGWFGFMMMAIFWFVIIAAAVGLFNNLFPQSRQTTSGDAPVTAVAILKKRYARGEISQEEFEAMRHNIEQ